MGGAVGRGRDVLSWSEVRFYLLRTLRLRILLRS